MNEPVADGLGEYAVTQVHVLGLHQFQGEVPGAERSLGERSGAYSPRLATLEQPVAVNVAGQGRQRKLRCGIAGCGGTR
jgi:hypothetical protein